MVNLGDPTSWGGSVMNAKTKPKIKIDPFHMLVVFPNGSARLG